MGGNSEFEINTKYRLGLGGHKHLFLVKLCTTKKTSLYLVPLVIRRVTSCEGVDAFSLTFTPGTASLDTSWTSGNTENQGNSCIFRKTHILEFPSVMLCVSIKNKKKKKVPRQTVMNPGKTGPYFQARDRLLTLCPGLGSPRGWRTTMTLARGLPRKPEAGVTCCVGRWQETTESVSASGSAIHLPSGKLPSGHWSPHPS